MGNRECVIRIPKLIAIHRVIAGTLRVPIVVLFLFEDQEDIGDRKSVPSGTPGQIEKAARIISEIGNIQK
jgi:hypothetical protein